MRFGFVAFAVLFSVLISACDSGPIPNGWDRNDYIAYLIFSDALQQARKNPNSSKFPIFCIADNVGLDSPDLHDPSAKLMESLLADNEDVPSNLKLRLASECEARGSGQAIVERSTGSDAMWFVVGGGKTAGATTGSGNPSTKPTRYTLGWHNAPLLGGGVTYRIEESQNSLIVIRNEGMWME